MGWMCNYFYNRSPQNSIHLKNFQVSLNTKINTAEKNLENIKTIIIHTSVDSVFNYKFLDNDITYYVFIKSELAYWSDNHQEISKNMLSRTPEWHLTQTPNAIGLAKTISFESYRVLALIKLKNNYSYENDELANTFADGFNTDKQIQLRIGSKTDKYPVLDKNDNYLFSLLEPASPVYNDFWATLGFICYSVFFLLLFVLYANLPFIFNKKTLKLKQFIAVSTGSGIILALLLYFHIPSLLFSNKLFTPFQYASNPFLMSISHLTVFTAYFISSICLFYFYTKIKINSSFVTRGILQLSCILYFTLVYYILSGLIYHSSIQLTIQHIKDFSGISIWVHLLILIWGFGLAMLFLKTHNYSRNQLRKYIWLDGLFILAFIGIFLYVFPSDWFRISISFILLWGGFYLYLLLPSKKNIYLFTSVWVFAFSVFMVWNSLVINNQKKFDKYKILAQNIYINGSSENDQMADIMLEELNLKLLRDKKWGKLLSRKDSIVLTTEYLNKTYLRGFWNKFEMRLNIAKSNSAVYKEYRGFISANGSRMNKTHFYSIPANENNMSYIGEFFPNSNPSDSVCVFMEFYPRRNFKSYSFPNLLISNSSNIQHRSDISIAKYERGRLVFSSGKHEYNTDNNWIPTTKSDFFKIIVTTHKHYIYRPNNSTYIVVTELDPFQPISHLLYLVYTFLGYFALSSLLVWLYIFTRKKWQFRIGLTTKFQFTFIALLIISFIGIFFVSVNFIEKKYREQQITNLENKKSYIQKALQDLYYWSQDLNAQNTQQLNFDLQDLSYIYHTDIHVYDNRGELIGSSQPIIFNKNLISSRISPIPYFRANSNLNQYEHIGNLNFLSGYCDFYNGDYLQIGFISIPQFFSQDEIKSEIESFLSVILQIYLIITILAVLLSLFIGKQLSAPLNILENKLKEMRIGRRNEKIDYTLNDEIGQLVIQYNRTVDELDKSARLLAQSERESAWKLMARQVAHEINNPLTPMKLTIQQLQRTKKMEDANFDEYFIKSTSMLIEQIDNLSRIAGTFSNFARMPEASFERFDIDARLSSVVQLYVNNNEHVSLEFRGSKTAVFVNADPEQMVQVFNNLLKNAIQAIPENKAGKILVQLKTKKTEVVIDISDNGTGIDPALQDKLFVPNFTTKSTGMGLGLAISKNIVEISGGNITFSTEPQKGTTFRITLPVAH